MVLIPEIRSIDFSISIYSVSSILLLVEPKRTGQLNGLCIIQCICSAQSRNQDNSRVVLDKVRILTLSGEAGNPTWHGSILELSLCKVGIGTK